MMHPTGLGKTTEAAELTARHGSTCWLADRRESVEDVVKMIERSGGEVGRVLPLDGYSYTSKGKVANCIHADVIEQWQAKGYAYRAGFCMHLECCEREADLDLCPFLASIARLKDADNIACTKALGRKPNFFSSMGNENRDTVVLDEDSIGLMRPEVEIVRKDLVGYLKLMDRMIAEFNRDGREAARDAAVESRRVARWCLDLVEQQAPESVPVPTKVPPNLRPRRAVLDQTRKRRKEGRKELRAAFFARMRKDPVGTLRNVLADLDGLTRRAAGRLVYATVEGVIFHIKTSIPADRRVICLDATATPELLAPIFAPRPVVPLGGEVRVQPAGRIVQFMDANYPRGTLAQSLGDHGDLGTRPKVLRIMDAIGDNHPEGKIVLITYKNCIEPLCKASRHSERIQTAHFGAVRGRNDLQGAAVYVVIGSPKATEESRQRLALAVFGPSIFPFPDLVTVQVGVAGRIPRELTEDGNPAAGRIFTVRCKGYLDPRMQAVYEHTVTAELTHAVDRARVLNNAATVYLVTNEPCSKLWFAEMAFAADLLDLSDGPRADFREACAAFRAKALELLNEGRIITGADVCRALGHAETWGKRYWSAFRKEFGDALEGMRKIKWKDP
jgi:hypothetical protein